MFLLFLTLLWFIYFHFQSLLSLSLSFYIFLTSPSSTLPLTHSTLSQSLHTPFSPLPFFSTSPSTTLPRILAMSSGAYDMPRARPNDEGGRASRATNRMSGGGNSNGNNNNVNGSSQDYYATGQQQQQQHQQQQQQQRTSEGHSRSSPAGHIKCKDKECRNYVTWRNIDNIGGIMPEMMNGNHSSNSVNNTGALILFYANQEAREVQMKLLDIVSATGLAQADIPTLGARPPSFAMLPPVGAPQQPLHSSAAWTCAQYDAERDRREWFFRQRKPHLPYWRSEYCEEHTCRYFFTKEMCSTKKPKHDALCNTRMSPVPHGVLFLCENSALTF